jgi:hypothetical protein
MANLLPPPTPLRCAACEQRGATILETMALCPGCRAKFTRFYLPIGLKVVAWLLALIAVLNLARMPFLISTVISTERQKSALQAHIAARRHMSLEPGP